MTSSRKRTSQGSGYDERFLDGLQDRPGRWNERGSKPLSARQTLDDFQGVSARPANDDGRSILHAPEFVGSRYFWSALIASLVFCVLFVLLMGYGSASALSGLTRNPAQYGPFFASILVIAGLQWLFALSAYRQAVNSDIWRRVMLVTQRLQEPSPLADEANRKINTSFDRLFADIDARMLVLDEKTAQLANQIANAMQQSTQSADANITNMRSIVDASEIQRDALQQTGMMISTEILPVIAKLETTINSLDTISQHANGMLENVGERLQQSAREMKSCLDDFNRANHTVAPEIEKRMLKFEASIARLPELLDATIGRLSPMSETIADAAMLSTANIDVIDQLAKDITATLDRSRMTFADISASSVDLFRDAVDSHAGRFREMLQTIVEDEAGRVSGLSRELGQLADTAKAVVDRLQQPVSEVAFAADQALVNMNQSVNVLDERIQANLGRCVAELNDAASRLVSSVNREIEASTLALQTRIAASSSDLVQRVGADTARFEALIGETADRTSVRISSVIKDLPAAVAQRMETEITKIDGSLKSSVVGLSDQMRLIIDTIPGRLSAMTRETLRSLEANLEQSFEGVAQRSGMLNEQFRKNATETTEGVLAGYVDFIFLALDRFRKELEEVNHNFTKEIEGTLKPLPNGGVNITVTEGPAAGLRPSSSLHGGFATRLPDRPSGN